MDTSQIIVTGSESLQQAIKGLSTESPAMRRHIMSIIRKEIAAARKRICEDVQDVLDNDPRKAYLAVRSSIYKQVLGAQVNILPTTKRGAPTTYVRHRKLDDNPRQRGGNRRKRNERTMQMESYQGVDRGFILRFQNAGTATRETRFGNRGSLRARRWFGTSSAFHVDQAANAIAEMIEQALNAEFKLL